MIPGNDPYDRVITAYHEAAHAVTAAALGKMIQYITIQPSPPSQYFPGSLGHIHWSPHPPPRPVDCWIGSYWTESWVMIRLAGYLVADLEWPNGSADEERLLPAADHERVAAMLRALAPGEPELAATAVRELRAKTFRLLSQPAHAALLHIIAGRLLADVTIDGKTFYKLAFKGRCGAVHPTKPHVRCTSFPHPYADHLVVEDGQLLMQFRGLPMPIMREKVSQLPGNVKRVRAINEGGPGPKLTKAWQQVLSACDELNIPAEEYEMSPLPTGVVTAVELATNGLPAPTAIASSAAKQPLSGSTQAKF